MDILGRLKKIIETSGLSVRAFSIRCGINQATLDKQVKGLRSVSSETLLSVLAAFPEISAEWLMREKGEMTIQDIPSKELERINKLNNVVDSLQGVIDSKNDTISKLNEQIRQLENQLQSK